MRNPIRVRSAVLALALLVSGAVPQDTGDAPQVVAKEAAVHIEYLEIVTPEVGATCRALEELHGVQFSEPVAELGGARTAKLAGGGRIGVRAPLREDELPVVRPYVLVADIEAAVAAARAAGGVLALPPMELPGQGTCAIYVQGGIEHGLWQAPQAASR
jgi:uncharacterized protein